MVRYCAIKTDGVGSVLVKSKFRWPVFLGQHCKMATAFLLRRFVDLPGDMAPGLICTKSVDSKCFLQRVEFFLGENVERVLTLLSHNKRSSEFLMG